MNFKILVGDDMTRKDLDKIFELDKKVYGPIGEKAGEDFVGTIDNMVDRFTHNKRTFVCLLDNNVKFLFYFLYLEDPAKFCKEKHCYCRLKAFLF